MKKKKSTRSKSKAFGFFLTLIFLLSCSAGAAWSIKKFYESLNASLTKMNEKPIATITFKHKTAQRKFQERMIWDRLRQHSPVYDGDTIRTAPESEATIYFEDGNVMELGENTMAQVFFHDGQVETTVSGGSFVVNSSEASNGFTVRAGTSNVIVSAGSSIGASVSEEDGTSVKVASGQAVFTDESGLARSIEEGGAISLDASGDEQIIPVITVYSPAANAKVLAFEGDKETVDFKWSAQNMEADDSLVLQISRDKKFKEIEQTIDLDGMNENGVDFKQGVSYWRIYPKKAGLQYAAQSKVNVLLAPPPLLVAPESRSTYSFKTKLPEVRFSWTANDIVTAFDLQVADNPQMENPALSQRTTTPSSIISTLGTGTWYWRVVPYYTINKIGLAKPSEVRAFTITQRQGLEPPELILPAADERINIALKDQIVFSWKNNPEASGYEVMISQDPQGDDAKLVEKKKTNFITIKPSELAMQEGTWYWRVTQFDSDGDVSNQSEVRKFTTDKVAFEQRALYPPDNFVTVDTSVAELRFTWKSNVPGDNKFQIARDKNFTSLVVDQVDNDKFYQGASLAGGQYYWRISSASNPEQFTTEPRALHVASQLANPALSFPRQNQTLVLLGDSSTNFSWNAIADADYYLFNLYSSQNSAEPILSERVTQNQRAIDLSKFADGDYTWSIQAAVDESANAARRVSSKTEGAFKIAQLRKVKLLYPENGATVDGFSALAYPDSARWSCEQELKQAAFTLSKNPNGYSDPIFTARSPARIVKFPRLEPGVYYWTVRGSNAAGLDVSALKANSFTVKSVQALQNPRLSSPANNTVYGAAQIRASRKITFAWQPVPNATSYMFTIRNARGLVLISKRLSETHYDLPDMAELKNGRFTYSVQASQNLSDGTLARQSGLSTASFAISLPAAGEVVINDTGVLYGM